MCAPPPAVIPREERAVGAPRAAAARSHLALPPPPPPQDNQAAVGDAIHAAIAAGEVTREELFITTKVAFYPAACDGTNSFCPITFNANNKKDTAAAGIAESLALLRLAYVDLLLIHNPCTDLAEYAASAAPHAFELGGSILDADERRLVLAHRLSKVMHTGAVGAAARAAAWAALVAARAAGQAKFVGVSNYPSELIAEMEASDSPLMPAVNQLEFHPRSAWPALRAQCAATGVVLTAYGSGNSARIEKSAAVAAVAARRGETPIATVLAWTLAKGVVVIPRSANAAHIAANMAAAAAAPFTPEDMAALDALNEAHAYYWSAMPLLPKGARADV